MTYVYHPNAGDDLPGIYFENNDASPPNRIQLKAYQEQVMDRYMRAAMADLPRPEEACKLEPVVPFTKISIADFKADRSFQYALLCQSPGFTPVTSDALIPIFAEYIDFERPPDAVIADTTALTK